MFGCIGSVEGSRLPVREENRRGCWGMPPEAENEVVNAETAAGKRKRPKLLLPLNF